MSRKKIYGRYLSGLYPENRRPADLAGNCQPDIALGISLLTLLCDGRTTPAYKRLFNHSITVGLTARLLTRNFRMGISDDILIDGMLHYLEESIDGIPFSDEIFYLRNI
ncbi:MAG: hypothetical protein ABFR82_00660 [Nitrospirota bacterium]